MHSLYIARSALALAAAALAGCSTFKPPRISYDEPPEPAVLESEPPKAVEVVEVPKLLPLPGQLKPLAGARSRPEPRDPKQRVDQANAAARIQPSRSGYLNAVQVYPFADGALYQVYAAPGQVTDIALQEGEQLVGTGPVAAGDTVRWIVGDTESGNGDARRVHIMVKPTRPAIETNLVVNTDRRTYLIELRSREKLYMPSVAWFYPEDRSDRSKMLPPTPVIPEAGQRRYRYVIEGDSPPWRPINAYDDGRKAYIEFSPGIGQGEMPPLFVIGQDGKPELVNYRAYKNVLIVDRLFAAAELRLGAEKQQRVRIVRNDGRRS
jgi:type IV secretion system protein TrbG